MAGLPDALQRRALLYGSAAADHAAEARKYIEAEEHADALEFALKVDDDAQRGELVRELRDLAQRQGNWFLLNRMDRVEALPEEVWRKAFDAARASGKNHYALKIARKLGDGEAVEALELELGMRQPEPEVSAVGAVEPAETQDADSEPAAKGDAAEGDDGPKG